MSAVDAGMAARIRERASDRCEYCRMHQSLQGATFHIEHVHPSSRGGPSDFGNLALCCPSCNLHKADRTHAIDPATGRAQALFHPRTDVWDEHFAWVEERVDGRTASGRATIAALKLNTDRRLLIRRAESRFGLFPPP
jgi:hypothetical protein